MDRTATLAERLANKLNCGEIVARGPLSATLTARVAAATGQGTLVIADAASEPDGPLRAEAVVVVAGEGDQDRDPATLEAAWARAGLETAWRGSLAGDPRAVLVVAGRDAPAHALLRAGAESLLLDPALDTLGADPDDLTGLRVGIVTYELQGVRRYGGIGTSYRSLGRALAAAGAEVEILYTGLLGEDEARGIAAWQEAGLVDGVRLDALEGPESDEVATPYWDARRAHAAYTRLRERHAQAPFDVVHVPESRGHGAFCLAAKHAGLDFDGVTFVVHTHGDREYLIRANRRVLADPNDLVVAHLERTSLELADLVFGPTAWLHGEIEAAGTRLPRRTFVQQNVLSASTAEPRPPAVAAQPIDELVFFGRLDRGKGLPAFLSAVDVLAAEQPPRELRVTLLGAPASYDGLDACEHVARHARHWPFPVEHLDGYDQQRATRYLRERPCLPVAPSHHENGPNTVLEPLALGIPFVSLDASGVTELVDPRDRARVLAPWSDDEATAGASLAATIARVLDDPRPARFATPPDATREAHLRWHAAHPRGAAVGGGPDADAPAVAVAGAAEAAIALAEGEEPYVLLLDERHALRDDAVAVLGAAAGRTGASAIAFAVAAAEGDAVLAAPGGPAECATLHDVFSTSSVLVRRDAAAGVRPLPAGLEPRELIRVLLLRLALAGERILSLPQVLADEVAAGPDDAMLRRPAPVHIADTHPEVTYAVAEPFRAAGAGTTRDLAALVQLMAGAALRAETDVRALREQVEEALAWARASDARLEQASVQRDLDLAVVDGLQRDAEVLRAEVERERAATADCRASLDRSETALAQLRERRAVRLALRGAEIRSRLVGKRAER